MITICEHCALAVTYNDFSAISSEDIRTIFESLEEFGPVIVDWESGHCGMDYCDVCLARYYGTLYEFEESEV